MPTTEEYEVAAAKTAKDCGARLVTTTEDVSAFLDQYDTFLLDCDGVLWHSGEALPGAVETIAMLRRMGKAVNFVTNNSTKSREQYIEKCRKVGITVNLDEMFPSSHLAARLIHTNYPHVKKAYVIGASGVRKELEAVGVEVVGAEKAEEGAGISEDEFMAMTADPDIGAVVVGWDLAFSFRKLCTASLLLEHNKDCVFIATNLDPCDSLGDRTIPGNGAAVAALEVGTGRKAIVAGKPSGFAVDLVLQGKATDRSRICMVGDRLDTDIAFGRAGGIASVLVMSGTTTTESGLTADSPFVPTHVLPYFGKLGTAAGEAEASAAAVGAGAGEA